MPPIVVARRWGGPGRGRGRIEIGKWKHLHVDRSLGELDEVVVEIVELAQVVLSRRHVEEMADPERAQVLRRRELRDVAIVELAVLVGVVGETVAIEDKNGGRVRRALAAGFQEHRPVEHRRRQREVGRNDSERMRPVVEREDRLESRCERGRDGDRGGTLEIEDQGSVLRHVHGTEERENGLAPERVFPTVWRE